MGRISTSEKLSIHPVSLGIRSFWDPVDHAPLTKKNPITVRGAHINILTHITMQELAVSLGTKLSRIDEETAAPPHAI